jgi:dTMP kinase
MGLIVAIEGGDGAGKATATANVVEALQHAGLRAATTAFPRYADTVGGAVLGDFLAGRLDRPVTVEAAAVLYALDRLESRSLVNDLATSHDVLVLDRYIASNMAYQAAKVAAADAPSMMQWIWRLETDQFAMPGPDLSVYLDTPLELARELILRKRPRNYTDRSYDEHEADIGLQRLVRENYSAMVRQDLAGPWLHVPTMADDQLRPAGDIAAEITAAVQEALTDRGK